MLAKQDWNLIATFRPKFTDFLKQYYFIGGMPEVVNAFIEHKDYTEVRQLQQNILDSYDRDFSKHAPMAEVPKIRMVWRSVPAQLTKENRKFIYGVIKEGARAKEFELAIEWLLLQLKSVKGLNIYYWSSDTSKGELDFLLQKEIRIIPVEVKAEENLQSKSLRSFVEKNPGLHGIRFSMSDYREQEWLTNYPLYAAGYIF